MSKHNVLPPYWPKDMAQDNIQEIILRFLTSEEAPEHQPLQGTGNRCVLSDSHMLSLHQLVAHTVANGIARNPQSPNRGLLCWHSTGSGKTLTATSIMDAFWDTKKNIVFATSVEAANSNPPSTFHKYFTKYFKRFQERSDEFVKKEFEKRKVKFFTFAQLAHYLLIANPLKSVKTEADKQKHSEFLKDAVIIIDEVHNIFKPLPNQKLENNALKNFLMDVNNPLTSDLKIFILTATPGDTPQDVLNLLNMIRNKSKPALMVPDTKSAESVKQFKQDIQGLVSYFNSSRDYSRFPRAIEQPLIKVHMSPKQFEKYAENYNKEPNTVKNANTLLKTNQINQFYKHARRYSNMLYNVNTDNSNISEFSAKLPALLETLAKYPYDKHYIYSAFHENRGFGGHGILAIGKVVEKYANVAKATDSDVAKMSKGDFSTVQKKRRYVVVISNEVSDNKEKLKTIITAFNRLENKNGEYIQLFLASQNYNEGIDLRGVKHIHIFEPLLTCASEKQTIGRAVRYCSHSDLPQEEWHVKIHRYISEEPQEMYIYNLSYYRDRIEYFTEEYNKLTHQIKELGTEYKTVKEDMKQEGKKIIENLKELQRKYNELERKNIKSIKMIDVQVMEESKERAKEISKIYDTMKKAAVDYLIFKDFHEL